jgi:hypothetical protein
MCVGSTSISGFTTSYPYPTHPLPAHIRALELTTKDTNHTKKRCNLINFSCLSFLSWFIIPNETPQTRNPCGSALCDVLKSFFTRNRLYNCLRALVHPNGTLDTTHSITPCPCSVCHSGAVYYSAFHRNRLSLVLSIVQSTLPQGYRSACIQLRMVYTPQHNAASGKERQFQGCTVRDSFKNQPSVEIEEGNGCFIWKLYGKVQSSRFAGEQNMVSTLFTDLMLNGTYAFVDKHHRMSIPCGNRNNTVQACRNR